MAEIFNIDYKRSNGSLDITFSGQLNINSIKKITEGLKSNLGNVSNLNLRVKDVENMDLTFIQLLHSIKNSGKKKGYKVNLSVTLGEELKTLIINAGFGDILNSTIQI